jgi:hypothetical protein
VLIESLTAALLLVALVAAWASRRPRGLARWGWPVLVVLGVAVPAALTVYGLGFLNRMGTVSLTSLAAAAGWTLAFVLGSFVVISSAPRAGADPATPPWSVRGLGVAFAAAAVLTVITMSNLDVAVKGQLAAVRVEAGARAMALAPPRLPDSQNAAAVYRKAFAALTPPDQLPELLRDRAGAWGQYDRAAFDPADREQTEFLDSQQRGLALLREAAAMPNAAFDRDLSGDTSPVDIPVPELPRLRHGATLLAYDALARSSRGDAKGALDDVAAVFGIARHIKYPLLIDLLTAVAVEKTGAKALEDVLALAPPKPEDLARLSAAAGEPFRDHLRRTLAMEEAWGMAAVAMIATGRAGGSPDIAATTAMDKAGEWVLVTALYRVFFVEEDLAAYRRHMRVMREDAAKPAPAMLDGLEAHDKVIRDTRGGGIVAGLLLPATYKVAYAALDGDATRGLVRLAVAATLYKAKHGKHPEKLAELVPEFIAEVPPDPYDGRPLRPRRGKDGLVLYSAGRDRDDDGGRPMDEEKHEGDLVFRLK